jgi:hypothetical protein
MHIKSIKHNIIAMFPLKTLYPGGILPLPSRVMNPAVF